MKNLAILLGKTESEVQEAVAKLEDLCGFPSEDVRLLSDNTQKLNAKLSQLGLDPHDTTGPELYHALLTRYARDAAAFDRALGIDSQTSAEQKLSKVKTLLEKSLDLHEVWVIKNTVAKNLLRQIKPKRLMKLMNYRSLDSMLKRQDAPSLLLAAEQIESATWQKTFESRLAKLSSTDYELRAPSLVRLNAKLSQVMPVGEVLYSNLAGCVAIKAKANIPTLTLALMLMDGLEQIGEHQNTQNIYNAHPALAWWADAEALVYNADGTAVSLNFKDLAANHLANNDFGDHQNRNAHQRLWAELMARYKNYLDELPANFTGRPASTSKLAPNLILEPVEVYE